MDEYISDLCFEVEDMRTWQYVIEYLGFRFDEEENYRDGRLYNISEVICCYASLEHIIWDEIKPNA